MWVIFILMCSVAYAQPVDVGVDAVDVKSIDLPYTPEQKEIVGDFTQRYFADTKFFRQDSDVTIEQFLVKSDVEQDTFISNWAAKEKLRLESIIINLQAQIVETQSKLTELIKALGDWSK